MVSEDGYITRKMGECNAINTNAEIITINRLRCRCFFSAVNQLFSGMRSRNNPIFPLWEKSAHWYLKDTRSEMFLTTLLICLVGYIIVLLKEALERRRR